MDTKKLSKWADLLLDTGKRNNLINYRDTKSTSLEIVVPVAVDLFLKTETNQAFEVYEPRLDYDEEMAEEEDELKLTREDYISLYSKKIKKSSQMLLYSGYKDPVTVLKNIGKKSREHLEENGVNVAYIAFGFIHWRESENSEIEYKAPLLLAPISFENESAVTPWFVKMSGEDPIINPAFVYKIENEFNIRLPEYNDEGFEAYVELVRGMLRSLGWTVSTECKIGLFSFLKLNMYQDIKLNESRVLANENVRLLLGENVIQPDILDEKTDITNPLLQLHCVVDADSSQLEAIEMAKNGKSFVLQGPPGTGKSQTITNIIAESIYDGKKVLFVSEKQAALNVVYDKLKKAGLDEFCLELHSHKANKKNVIAELNKTLKTNKKKVSSKADIAVSSLEKYQKELDNYVIELHKNRPVINRSLYQLFELYSGCNSAANVDYSVYEIHRRDEEYLAESLEYVEQYAEYIPYIGYNYRNNPWYGYIARDNSAIMQEKVLKSIGRVAEAVDEYKKIAASLLEKYGIKVNTISEIKTVADAFSLIAGSGLFTPEFFNKTGCEYLYDILKKLSEMSIEVLKVQTVIDADYDADIYSLDSFTYSKKLKKEYDSGFKRLFSSEYKNIIREIKLCSHANSKPGYEEAIELLDKLSEYHLKMSEYTELEKSVKSSLGKDYIGVCSDFELIISEAGKLSYLFDAGLNLGYIAGFDSNKYNQERVALVNTSKEIFAQFGNNYEDFNHLSGCYDCDIFDLYNTDFESLIIKLKSEIESSDRLENWCRFHELYEKMINTGVNRYIDAAIYQNISADNLATGYKKVFYKSWIDYIIHENKALSEFSYVSQEQKVNKFRELDSESFNINIARIKAVASAKRPGLDFIAQGSAVAVLLREAEKKRKQKNLRELFAEIPELIQVIKPCFLMSPLSVSTYLSSGDIQFDLVVFDEASQVFPQDAIGAIYRGKQLIVVGDSKQMPPSNFFNASSEDSYDDELGDITDFESILDVCSTVLPQRRLRWHYRSRYEQLINFSNISFYDNELVTFPSSKTDREGIGIDYHYVSGEFDHKSRSNRKEAEYIVDLIYRNIDKYPDRSLGVVAFSISQQALIEKLLLKRRQSDPSKESFFSSSKEEPFFIKNLETVQGDERDTIIFSIAYAKDSTGRLMHNFGPLNRAGGERRLNVAVTRAKMNVQLVTSLHHTDIDLSRTGAEGAKLLKYYLDYAENGEAALERQISVNPYDEFDSDFEQEVCSFLRENGYQVDTQVGCSNFKIDLGIRIPDTSDYILAVECDGATYHSSKNARDRDRLRQQILERMGWKFYRIWSTDWYKNQSISKDRLLMAVKMAFERRNSDDIPVMDNSSEAVYEEEKIAEPAEFPKYKITVLDNEGQSFADIVFEVMKNESPLNEEWFLKRYSWAFDREKVTSFVKHEYQKEMVKLSAYGIVSKNGFLYFRKQLEEHIFMLRVPATPKDKREIELISIEELAAGLYTIIKFNVSVQREGLYKCLIKQLGINRLTDTVEARLDEAFEYISPLLCVDGDEIQVKKK